MYRYFGTLVNVITVLFGSGLGMILKGRGKKDGQTGKRDPLPETMMMCLGLCTLFASASGLVGVESGAQAIVVVASMVLGLLIGYWLRIDFAIEKLGERLGGEMKEGQKGNPASGFVTACMLFCIGSMTILGSFESAANPADHLELGCHTTLLIKSLLDLVSAACLTVTFGASVMASAAFVLIFQGGLTCLAAVVQPFLNRIHVMPMMNCVGSLILIAIAINLMGIRKTRTADYLPAILITVLICSVLYRFGISV